MSVLPEKGAIFDLLDILRRERKKYGARRVHVIGSRIKGAYQPHSDVDLIVDSQRGPESFPFGGIERGKRSGVAFDLWRTCGQADFLDPREIHRTIKLQWGKKKKITQK